MRNFWGVNWDFKSDSAIAMTNGIVVPAGARMQFNHAFDFEDGFLTDGTAGNFDGGVVEYSTDNGVSWQDAGGLICVGRLLRRNHLHRLSKSARRPQRVRQGKLWVYGLAARSGEPFGSDRALSLPHRN